MKLSFILIIFLFSCLSSTFCAKKAKVDNPLGIPPPKKLEFIKNKDDTKEHIDPPPSPPPQVQEPKNDYLPLFYMAPNPINKNYLFHEPFNTKDFKKWIRSSNANYPGKTFLLNLHL